MRPVLLFLVAGAARLLVAWQTPIPAGDGAHYLWMAEAVSGGRPEALFETVFHPLYPALVAALLLVFPSLDGVTAGQIVAGGMGAAAVLPLYWLTRRLFGVPAAMWAGVFYAVGTWFCRHPADCMSEGPFYLLVSTAVLLLVNENAQRRNRRVLVAGLLCALAYTTRPEGAALAGVGLVWLWSRGERRRAVLFAVGCSPALLLGLGFALWGEGFTLTPKASFVYQVGVGQGGLALYFENLVRLPGVAFEDLGYLTFALAVWGAVRWRPRAWGDPGFLLVVPFAVQCLAIPLVHSHYRFLSGYGILLMPLAGAAWVVAAGWLRERRVWLPTLGLLLLLMGDLVRLPQARRRDRLLERELGLYLRQGMEQGEGLATDMPRLAYFAGCKPPPPRAIVAEDILEACESSTTRYLAIVRERTPMDPADMKELGFSDLELPPALARLVDDQRAHGRDILVQER